MIKLTALLPRHPSMTHDEFVAYHKDVHAPLLRSDPLVRRLVRRCEQCHPTPAQIPRMPQPPVDGIAELWFDDLAAAEAFYADEHYVAVIQRDEARFIDLAGARVMLTTVNPVFDASQADDGEAVAALKRFYAAEEEYVVSGAEDFSVIAETLHDDVVMHQAPSLPYGGEWRGREGVAAWMDAVSSTWSKVEHRDVRIFAGAQDTAFTRARAVVTSRASGRTVEFPILHQVTIRDGRLLQGEPFYWDTAAVLEALPVGAVGVAS
jgi:ketosteroid isomerase-like protein